MKKYSINSIIFLVIFISVPIFLIFAVWGHPFWSPLSLITWIILIPLILLERMNIPFVRKPTFDFNDDTPSGRPIGPRVKLGGGKFMQLVIMPRYACKGAKFAQAEDIVGLIALLNRYVMIKAIGYETDFNDVQNADMKVDGGTKFLRRVDNEYPSTFNRDLQKTVHELHHQINQWATLASSAKGSNIELLRDNSSSILKLLASLQQQ